MVRLRIKNTGALRGPAKELPFVSDAYFIMLDAQFGRKRIKRRGKLQDSHRSLVDFRVAAAASKVSLHQTAVGTDGHFDYRRAGQLLAPCHVGKIHRSHAL